MTRALQCSQTYFLTLNSLKLKLFGDIIFTMCDELTLFHMSVATLNTIPDTFLLQERPPL
jgi:hypothetical protein